MTDLGALWVRPQSALVRVALAAFLLTGTASLASAQSAIPAPAMAQASSVLELSPEASALRNRLAARAATGDPVAMVYAERGFAPMWHAGNRLSMAGEGVLAGLARAGEHGLNPDLYVVPAAVLAGAVSGAPALAEADIELSDRVAAYLEDVRFGLFAPGIEDSDTDITAKPKDVAGLFRNVVMAGDVEAALAGAGPQTDRYRSLVAALKILRSDMQDLPWGVVSSGPTLRPGEVSGRVGELRSRLMMTGEYLLPADPVALPHVFDQDLVEAVRRFQLRHGLADDGAVGPQTLGALNATRDDRIRQVLANLERARWAPEQLGSRHVVVNVPAFQLTAVENSLPVLEMRVIVGRRDRPTPIFSDVIRYLEFNPTWTVPIKIAVEDIAPAQVRDPDYLAHKGIRVFSGWNSGSVEIDPSTIDWSAYSRRNFPFRLQQVPGSGNSLGVVKFMFPNRYAVYLHDTPTRRLFDKAVRAFSSGCVRVSDPQALAKWLLGDRMSPEAVEERFARTTTQRVPLSAPVPVHLTYQTVWADGDGTLQFREDIYGRDARLGALVEARLNGAS